MFSSQEIDLFRRICSSLGIDLSEEMVDKFKAYTTLVLEWNQRMHLVSKRDAKPDRILRHFVDSLTIFKAIDIPKNAKLLDLGSGAGFPGVPIKIVRDDIRLTLVESIHKKTLFLRKLIQSLRLELVGVENRRAEELALQPALQDEFDIVTAKAVGSLREILKSSLPLLRTGGGLMAYKGRIAGKEATAAASLVDCLGMEVVRVDVPEMDLKRWIVKVRRRKQDA
jgi:16S rRNA (guanine527-N7)-methyltransferase